MARLIEFVDGNTGQVLRRVPASELPASLREIYLRAGTAVTTPEEADEIVPIARVVRLLVDAAGRPADPARATSARVQEFDADGRLRRETLQVQPAV